MFCVIGFILFGLLGIFSATHRELAKEAGACVFRRITFRPCTATFREKFKGIILSKFIGRAPFLARVFNKHFELLSWIFVILSVFSIVWAGKGAWNFYAYGSCNGLNSSGFCVFDPSGKNNQISAISENCFAEAPEESDLSLASVVLADFPSKGSSTLNEIVFIGCYNCDYTRRAYPVIQKLAGQYENRFVFIHFPIKKETEYLSAYTHCVYKSDAEKFWQFAEMLFGLEKSIVANKDYVKSLIADLGLNKSEIVACAENEETQELVEELLGTVKQTGIYGTPTVFINGKAFVGPKPERVYKRALRK